MDVAPRLRNVCASTTVKTILLQGPREEPVGSFEISLCYSQTVFSRNVFLYHIRYFSPIRWDCIILISLYAFSHFRGEDALDYFTDPIDLIARFFVFVGFSAEWKILVTCTSAEITRSYLAPCIQGLTKLPLVYYIQRNLFFKL